MEQTTLISSTTYQITLVHWREPDVCVCVCVCVLQALWFTAGQGLEGPVYGAADQWNGVGIFFDSFDNDGKVIAHKYHFKNCILLNIIDLNTFI